MQSDRAETFEFDANEQSLNHSSNQPPIDDDHDAEPAHRGRMMIVTSAAGALTGALILAGFGLQIGRLEARIAAQAARTNPVRTSHAFFGSPLDRTIIQSSALGNGTITFERESRIEDAQRELRRMQLQLDKLRADYASRIAGLERDRRDLLDEVSRNRNADDATLSNVDQRLRNARQKHLIERAAQFSTEIVQLRTEMGRALDQARNELAAAESRLAQLLEDDHRTNQLAPTLEAAQPPPGYASTTATIAPTNESVTGDLAGDHVSALLMSLDAAHQRAGSSLALVND